ncbi:hypothetical protein PYV50_19770 [Pseudomonas sp. H22_DOA]|nr:hypothetical protein PYV50_19770 [Pseudomonas sp. H22_DOA]
MVIDIDTMNIDFLRGVDKSVEALHRAARGQRLTGVEHRRRTDGTFTGQFEEEGCRGAVSRFGGPDPQFDGIRVEAQCVEKSLVGGFNVRVVCVDRATSDFGSHDLKLDTGDGKLTDA